MLSVFRFQSKGLDEVKRRLKSLRQNCQELGEGEEQVSLTELFTEEFMTTYTRFRSFEEMLSSAGYEVNSVEDFEKIRKRGFDAFISANTPFSTLEEMMGKAAEIWTKRRLGL